MAKSTLLKKKVIPLAVVLTLLILGIFNLNSVNAISLQGDGATFDLDEDDPLAYGVIIPSPNMYTTYSVSGSNQGEFIIMDWLGAPQTNGEIISDYPGDDISLYYPQYFQEYITKTPTSNGYINPWSTKFLNVSAYNAESDTLSPFTINSVYNYYVMSESGSLTVPLNYSIPIQVDMMLDGAGPKLLRFQFMSDEPPIPMGGGGPAVDSIALISPTGTVLTPVPLYGGIFKIEGATDYPSYEGYMIFSHFYYEFIAHESGTYRLLLNLDYDKPAYLELSFMDYDLSTIAPGTMKIGGNGDENPSWNELESNTFTPQFYRFRANKGELYSLYLGNIYNTFDMYTNDLMNMIQPIICIPCENGYGIYGGDWGTNIIYVPSDGYVYVSMTESNAYSLIQYSLYLNEIPPMEWGIGLNTTTIKISRDQYKALEFTVANNSFVRINYTKYMDGDIGISDGYNLNHLYFKDAKKLNCFESIAPLEVKTIENAKNCYYYLPAGDYVTLIANADQTEEGVIQIDSNFIELSSSAIPITSLSYPETYPSTFITAQFEPDDYYPTLKQAQVFDFTLNSLGQYRLNITINATDNLGVIPTSVNPSAVVVYNTTTDEYLDHTTTATTPLQSFKALENVGDRIYVAYPSKWHDLHFNISQLGVSPGGGWTDEVYAWDGDAWDVIDETYDETNDLRNSNGTYIMDIHGISGNNLLFWERGCDFDIPNVDEDAYYWIYFESMAPYTTIPLVDLITLSNITIHGNLNLAIVRDSGYQYCDYWEPAETLDQIDIVLNQETGITTYTFENWIFDAFDGDPNTPGFEGGNYKLLIIPDGWSHSGSLTVKVALEDYWGYNIETTHTIVHEPYANPWEIGNHVLVNDPILYNYTTYPYDLTITYNSTEIEYYIDGFTESYVAIHCHGHNYSWTQLVVESVNVSDYELYLLQDLPWINNNGPFQEAMEIDNSISGNNTIEFGVIEEDFTLLFEILGLASPNEMITLRIGLSQYNTTVLTTSEYVASYKAPSEGLSGPLMWGLVIGIPVAAGVIVLIYVLKKKGRIGSKTP
ncbi:MAG: hypothetical protein ACFFC3_04365 [Candidatus Odinarchaeota archaeon]